jgi:hypothetical protein
MTSYDRILTPVHHGPVRRKSQNADGGQHAAEPGHGVLKLQRSLGNAVVSRMLAQREGEAPEEEAQRSVDTSTLARFPIRRDAGPQEDEMQRTALQRAETPPEEEAQRSPGESHSHASPEVGLAGGPISDGLSSQINSKRGGGSALDAGSRTTMEGAFGSSFADVRIHTDSESDALNRSISAKAFTTGSDIFFSKSASPSDTQLLAHELTHVVQQRGSSSSGGMTVGPAGDAHETAADHTAAAVASGGAGAVAMRVEEAPADVARDAAAPEEEEVPPA